jgi:hypothetical protein
MQGLIDTDRVIATTETSATDGRIVWAPAKSLWLLAHMAGGLAALVFFPSLGGLIVFLLLSVVTLLAGHSVGMHRLLIHRSFQAPIWLERLLVWFGTLVGMAGPFGMIRAHDMRDWHQRQTECPPHPSHGAGWLKDAWWQLNCEFRLDRPPRFEIEAEVADDPWYRLMERHWMAQQVPLALFLFAPRWDGLGPLGRLPAHRRLADRALGGRTCRAQGRASGMGGGWLPHQRLENREGRHDRARIIDADRFCAASRGRGTTWRSGGRDGWHRSPRRARRRGPAPSRSTSPGRPRPSRHRRATRPPSRRSGRFP